MRAMFQLLCFLFLLTQASAKPDPVPYADNGSQNQKPMKEQKSVEGIVQKALMGLAKTAEGFLGEISGQQKNNKKPQPVQEGYSHFYNDPVDGTQLEAYVIEPMMKGSKGQAPVVLILHDWSGRDEYENDRAKQIAGLGYLAVAADLYGKTGTTVEENKALQKPFLDDRQGLLQRRLVATMDALKDISAADLEQVVVVGYGFGGTAALDMARAGFSVRGVATFHANLDAPGALGTLDEWNKPKVLVFHGYEDENVNMDEAEMSDGMFDWQLHIFGNGTKQHFTVAGNEYYHEQSDKRSFEGLVMFLAETLYKF